MQKFLCQSLGAAAAQGTQGGIVCGNGASRRALGLQKSAAFQLLQGALHGVWVDTRVRCQLAHGRDAASGWELPGHQCKLQLFNQLHIHRASGCDIPIHRAMLLVCIIVLRA